MSRGIGGDFSLNDVGRTVSTGWRTAPAGWHRQLFASGQMALAAACHTLQVRNGSRVALPAYLCNEVVVPFVETGATVVFYDLGPDLRTETSAVVALDAGTALVLDYFGTNTGAAAVSELRRQGVRVIYDRTQTELDRLRMDDADAVISSYRKTLPTTDGARLDIASDAPVPTTRGPVADVVALRAGAMALKAVFERTGAYALNPVYRQWFAAAEERLRRPGPPATISRLGAALLDRASADFAAARRRQNTAALLPLLEEIGVRPAVAGLANCHSPLGVPIRVPAQSRDRIRGLLIERGVFCPIHWVLPAAVGREHAAAWELSSEILTLPIDQRYGSDDMYRLASSLKVSLAHLRS